MQSIFLSRYLPRAFCVFHNGIVITLVYSVIWRFIRLQNGRLVFFKARRAGASHTHKAAVRARQSSMQRMKNVAKKEEEEEVQKFRRAATTLLTALPFSGILWRVLLLGHSFSYFKIRGRLID